VKIPFHPFSAVLFLVLASHGQEIKSAGELEKMLGLKKETSTPAPKTRGATRGAKSSGPADSPRAVTTRSASASPATIQRLRGRIEIEAVDGKPAKISVPVYQDAQANLSNILFLKDSTELADAASLRQVEEIARLLQSHADQRFVIEGHTCDLGSAPHNLQLSVARAAAIEQRLIGAGARPEQLVALGFGEGDPFVAISSGAGASDAAAENQRQKNRRVVIRLAAEKP